MDPLSLLHQFLSWIVPTQWSAVTLVVIAVLPFVLSWAAFRAAESVTAGAFFHVPVVYGLTAISGVCAGLALLHVEGELGRGATLASILRAGGRWDLSAHDFLVELANPFGYHPIRVVEELFSPGGGDALRLIVIAGLASLGAAILLALLMFRPIGAKLRALAAAAIVAFWSMALTVYLVSVAYWSVAQLNFWVIAIILLLLQYYRSHPHRT